MRSAVGLGALTGVAIGFASGEFVGSRDAGRAAVGDTAAPEASAARFGECVARLDAINGQLARIATLPAAAPAAPSRIAADVPDASRLEERLVAIEAAIGRIGIRPSAAAVNLETPPRHAKEVAAVDALFEAENRKRLVYRDDHLGYTADRLYDRYGTPDHVMQDPGDAGVLRWSYAESSDKRGVIFYLRAGVVVAEDPYQQQ